MSALKALHIHCVDATKVVVDHLLSVSELSVTSGKVEEDV